MLPPRTVWLCVSPVAYADRLVVNSVHVLRASTRSGISTRSDGLWPSQQLVLPPADNSRRLVPLNHSYWTTVAVTAVTTPVTAVDSCHCYLSCHSRGCHSAFPQRSLCYPRSISCLINWYVVFVWRPCLLAKTEHRMANVGNRFQWKRATSLFFSRYIPHSKRISTIVLVRKQRFAGHRQLCAGYSYEWH